MVCGGDVVGAAGRSSQDLEIGCQIDLSTGLVSFTANGVELETVYQVHSNLTHHQTKNSKCIASCSPC